jgi:hypothetical protein
VEPDRFCTASFRVSATSNVMPHTRRSTLEMMLVAPEMGNRRVQSLEWLFQRARGRVGLHHKVSKDEAVKWYQTKYEGVVL